MHSRKLWMTANLAIALLLPGMAAADGPIVIKLSHVAAKETPKGLGAERFKQLAEERTQGRVKVEVFPNSILYKDKEELEALQIGSVQMLAPSVSKFGPLGVKEFEVLDLPFITPDIKAFRALADGPVGKSMLQKLETRGIKGLAMWDAGFRVITSNRPIHSVNDMKGLKVRVTASKIIEAQKRSLGILTQGIAFSEVYQALQTGVVDGAETVLSNVWTQKFHEVQKYVTLTHDTHQAYALIANKKFWDGLPADIRTTLEGVIRDATIYANALGEVEENEAASKITASGKMTIIVPTKAESEELKKASLPIYKQMESRLGRANIEAVLKLSGQSMPN
ncbi:MAG TPA: DctP family TRAP transporter solute-binding subunit [Azonexus sp.]|nr:DctP family TRAP transporter solute-binding subunit [Azonexus sp.]